MKPILFIALLFCGCIMLKAQQHNNNSTYKISKKDSGWVKSGFWNRPIYVAYPDSARRNGISGTVYVSFDVEADSTVSNVRLVRGVAPILDREALRAVSLIGRGNPGIQDGKPVKIQYNVPIRFVLN